MNSKQYQEALELFKGYLYDEEVANLYTLELYHNIYEKIMLPIKEDLCFSTAFIVLLTMFSRPLNFFKFYIDLDQEPNKPQVPMNIYSINILKSGGGKGLTTNIVKKLLDFEYVKEQYLEGLEEKLSIGENPESRQEIHKSICKLKTIAAAEEQASATTAGMRKIDDSFKEKFYELNLEKDKWFGSAFFNIQELADALENAAKYDKDFFSTLKEMYDLGELAAKALSENIRGRIEKFYISFLSATTDKTLQNNPQISRAFNNYLISGNARRSLLCFPHLIEIKNREDAKKQSENISLMELYKLKRDASNTDSTELKQEIKQRVNRFSCLARKGQLSIKITDTCHFYYCVYKYLCEERSKKFKNPVLELEMENRFWKALKISGVLAMYDNTGSINENYFLEAVKIVEYYSHHLKRFMNNKVLDVSDKIIELLLTKKNGRYCAVTRASLSKNNEVLSYKNNYLTPCDFIEQNLKAVEESLSIMGYQLIVKTIGYKNKTVLYGACPVDWADPIVEETTPYYIYENKPAEEDEDIFENLQEGK